MALLLAERGTVTEAIVKPGWRVYPPRPRRAWFAYDTSRACARIPPKVESLLGGESADRWFPATRSGLTGNLRV